VDELLLEDGASKTLLEDGVSFLLLEYSGAAAATQQHLMLLGVGC
jgi:hypothetical protein